MNWKFWQWNWSAPLPPDPTPTPIITQVKPPRVMQTVNGTKLYTTAKSLLNTQVAPDNATDGYGMFGCALTLNGIARIAWGHQIGGEASTMLMVPFLQDSTKYTPVEVANVLPGDIVIAASTVTTHGHCGVIAQFGILSNNSEDGKLEEAWTLPAFIAYYQNVLGLEVHIFRPL